jgi:hypothetical protein
MSADTALYDRVQALAADERAYCLYWMCGAPDTTELEAALDAVDRHRAGLAGTAARISDEPR